MVAKELEIIYAIRKGSIKLIRCGPLAYILADVVSRVCSIQHTPRQTVAPIPVPRVNRYVVNRDLPFDIRRVAAVIFAVDIHWILYVLAQPVFDKRLHVVMAYHPYGIAAGPSAL